MMELLRELGPFHYMMNQGNVGDALIAASTVALFAVSYTHLTLPTNSLV